MDATRALLDHVDYVGPSGVSFMERDGRFYPHDANLRLGATSAVSGHAGFDFQRRAVEVALDIDGVRFSGRTRRGPYMRLDLEVEALLEAWRTRGHGGSPLTVVRGIAAVAVNPRGKLDPSPLDPFWVGELVANRLRHVLPRLRQPPRRRTIGDASPGPDEDGAGSMKHPAHQRP